MNQHDAVTEAGWPLDQLQVIGVNHRSASAETRDRLFLDPAARARLQHTLKSCGISSQVVMSTCNRTEVLLVADPPEFTRRTVRRILAQTAGLDEAGLESEMVSLRGSDALEHVFNVASSLDSLVIGEPEVLGQLKQAHREARDLGLVGRELELTLQAAYGIAKRVRAETAVAEGAVSIAAAAHTIARDLHGDLHATGLVLCGAGDMGEMITRHFKEKGVEKIRVTDRLGARARQVAHRLDCHWHDWDALDKVLVQADILITAGGAGRFILEKSAAKHLIRARRFQPMLAIDVAVPGDLDPALEAVGDIFLYTLSDLERIAAQGQSDRREAAEAARLLVVQATESFLQDRAERAAVPAIADLREQFEFLRRQVLSESPDDAEKATRLLLNRILHRPSIALKQLASVTDGAGTIEWIKAERLLKRLFDDKEPDLRQIHQEQGEDK